MLDYGVIVVGAGLAGAAAARLLAETGRKVLVVDKRRQVGGNCFDYKNANNITVHRYGPHIFHTEDSTVWQFVRRFAEFHYYQHRVLSYVDGMHVPFPINTDTVAALFGRELDCAGLADFLAGEVKVSRFEVPARNFRDAVVAQVGERLYELFFRNYTEKQWQQLPENLSPELAQRIPIRPNRDSRYFADRFQGIPRQGYTRLVENMLQHDNIALLLGVDYLPLKNRFDANLIVYTGQLDAFFDYHYGPLGYRSVELEFVDMDCEYYQTAPVINYPNDYEWTRVTEFKYFLNEESRRTTVLFEYPSAVGEPFYVTLSEENSAKRQQYLHEVRTLEESGKYVFVGRLAEYKYYNMDQVIAAAMTKVQEWSKRYGA